MGLYLGKEKISALRTIEKTTQSMKAYLDAGGKCASNNAVSFEGCWQASDWENVTDCSGMFSRCANLTSISPINASNATTTSKMFYYCGKLTSVQLMNTGNVTDMVSMFENCYSLGSISPINASNATTTSKMFSYCEKLTSVQLMNTGNVTDMSEMFTGCRKLTSIPAMDTSNVTNMDYMFNYCIALTAIHMTGMKVSFNISASTKFTREAIVEILNNLATVTTSPTLTMGSTNLAKLTDADKAIATGKGWKLA